MLKKKIVPVFIIVLLGLSILPNNLISVGVGSTDIKSFKDTLITSANNYTSAGYDFDKIVDPVFYENQVLCEGHLPLILDIETTKEFSLQGQDKDDFLKSSEIGKTNIGKINYKYNILIREDYSYIVTHYKTVKKTFNEYDKVNNTWNNYTANKTVNDYNETVNTYRYVWKDIKYIEKIDFKTTNKIIVDITGSFKASLGFKEVDIIPDIKIGDYTKSLDKYAWWNSNWNYAKLVTVDSSKVSGSGDLTDFSILVKINADSDIGANCQVDLDDIAFVSIDNTTQWKHEIESYSFAGNDLTAYLWLKIPTLSYNADTRFWLYYGNAGAANQEDVVNTWNSAYIAVYHMDSTTTTLWDSTENRHGTKDANTEPENAVGKIGNAQDFELADTEKITATKVGAITSMTVECWYKPESAAGTVESLVENAHIDGLTTQSFSFWRHSDGKLRWGVIKNGAGMFGIYSTTTLNSGTTYYCAGVLSDENYGRVFINGAQENEDNTITGNMNNHASAQLRIGAVKLDATPTYRYYADGVIDEVRISNTPRSNDWLLTTYNTINSPGTFLTFGAEQAKPVPNNAPEFSNPLPANESIQQDRPPQLAITVNDLEGNTFNLTYYSNSSGSWVMFGYNRSVTNDTFYQTNSNFSTSNTIYWWNVSGEDGQTVNSSNSSGIYHFKTKEGVSAPTSLAAPIVEGTSPTDTVINLTWAQGINATHTRIQHKTTGYPETIADGTNVYNGTAEAISDTSLNPGTKYYFRAWAWNGTLKEWATGNDTVFRYTYPDTPTSFVVTVINTTKITLTWTTGTGAEQTNISYKTTGYPENYEDGTSAYTGALETVDVTGLDPGTLYYFRVWGYDTASKYISLTNASDTGTTSTKVSNVTDFYVNTSTSTVLNLTWVNGNGTNTIIRFKNDSYLTGTTDGTLLLNDTTSLTSYQHTELNISSKHYYRIWSWKPGVYSTANTSKSNWTRPQIPQNATGTLYDTNLNITWDNSTGGDNVTIVKNSTAYPNNITDGTELCNLSRDTRYFNTSYTSGDYYALWSWNSTSNIYSLLHELLWGGLQINVYDENTSVGLTWDIFITNADGSQTSEYTGKTNPTSLDINIIPHGDNTALILSADSHRSRTYYMDLEPNIQYTVNAYLPKTNESELYLITVNNDYNVAVEDAKITFKRSIGGVYTNVSTMLTDANGQVNLYLMHDVLYKVEISKTGYDTGYSDYTPSSSIFVHTFKIYLTEGNYANATGCNEVISFQGFVQGGNLTLWYNDTAEHTDNTQIYIYEYNYSDLSNNLIRSVSNISNNTIMLTTSVNSTNPHYVYLFYNHSTCGFQKLTLFFSGKYGGSDDGGITNETKFNAIFDNYGVNPFGWSNTIVFIVLVGILFSLGQRNSGVALIASGVIGLFFMFILFGGMTDLRDTIPILFIILGILVQWRNNQREGGL